jgi:heptaprenyl diphosphate synthase
MSHVNDFHAQKHLGAFVGGHHPDAIVELCPWHRAANGRERWAWPVDFNVTTETHEPKPPVLHAAVEPRAKAETLELEDRTRRQTVAAGLVAGKLRGIDDQHVTARATSPRGRRRAGRPGPDDHHVGSHTHASQYVGRVRTPASVVAGVDFGDPAFAADVRDGVARIEDLMATELGKADELMSEAVQHLFQAGGKRFRPLFTVLSAQLGPEPDAWQVSVAGAVIELVHLATLYHDDVMDEAQVRRGAPSANARWSNNIAILAGDYLFATASRLVSRLGPEAVRVIADTFAQLVTGQMRETRGVADGVDEVEHYLKVVYEKTACLIAASGRFGATFSGADEDQIERLSRLGGIVGTAFQISDDIIDIDSDPDESGKVPGTDLREGVHTLPVLYALRDTGPDGDRLRQLLKGPVENDDDLAEALRLLRKSPGMTLAKDSVARYASQARDELANLPEGPGRQALVTLVDYTVNRHG